ncbi:MAG: TolC family protein [Nitrospirota bacterium]
MFINRQQTTFALITVIFFIGSLRTFAQESINLPQAINYALTQNKELRRSALAIDSGSLGVTGAKAEFQVSVRPEGSVGFSDGQKSWNYGLRTSKKFDWGTEIIARGMRSTSKFEGGDNLYRDSIQLEIQQPIFRNFGTLIHRETIIQANNTLRSASRKLEIQKADLIIEVVRTYENILRLKNQVRSDQESYKRMDGLYRVTKAKEVLGRTTRIDTLRVELLRGQALSRLEVSQERLTSTQRDFAELLGFSPDTVFDLSPSPKLEFKMPEPEEAIEIALKNRLDYAQVLQDYEDTTRAVRIAKRKLFPDVRLVARQEWFGQGPGISESRGINENIWFVGLSVDTDFNLTRERVALGQTLISQTSSSETINIVKLSITRQVPQQLQAYRRAREELKIAEKNFKLAEGRSKLARRLFELGRGDNFSVTDAEEAYLQAENQLLSARAEETISGYRLFQTMGTVIETPEELKPKSFLRDK